MHQMTTVRVEDIVKPHIRRSLANHHTYYKMYRKVMRRVKEASKAKVTRIEWSCPPFMWDVPPYDADRAVNYIVRKLQHGGFEVKRDGCSIDIDWAKAAKEHIRRAVSDTIKAKGSTTKNKNKIAANKAGTRARATSRADLMHQAERLITRMAKKK